MERKTTAKARSFSKDYEADRFRRDLSRDPRVKAVTRVYVDAKGFSTIFWDEYLPLKKT